MAFPVTNGEKANQTTFNKVAGRLVDNDLSGKQNLKNTDTASGADVLNLQREVNSLNAFTGRPSASAHDATPVWTNNDVGASTDTEHQRAEALTEEFNETTGHAHSGAAGDGAPITASDLTNFNNFIAMMQTVTKTGASGTSVDVTALFSTKTPGGADAAVGVYTTAPDNFVQLLADADETEIIDGGGQRVYGRLTESSGTWTLSFFTSEAGVETAHSLSSQAVRIYFYEVFTMGTRPTRGADAGKLPSLDATSDIADASSTQSGKVNLATQQFAGIKDFVTGVKIQSLNGPVRGSSGTITTGNTNLASEVTGVLPIANGGTGSATQNFVDLTTGQTIAGAKVFSGSIENQGQFYAAASNDATSGSDQTLATPATEIVRLTNAALVSLAGITAPSKAQKIILVNRTGVALLVKNDSVATAADRFLTGTGANMSFESNAALALEYDLTTARWQVVGGSGSGGSSMTVSATENISAAGTITAAASQRELRRVQGNAAAVTANTTTPITSGTTEGQELILKGMSDTNTVTITNSGNVTLNGDMILYASSVLSLVWIDSKWLEVARKI